MDIVYHNEYSSPIHSFVWGYVYYEEICRRFWGKAGLFMSFGEHFAEVVDENSELSNTRLVRIRDCFFLSKSFL